MRKRVSNSSTMVTKRRNTNLQKSYFSRVAELMTMQEKIEVMWCNPTPQGHWIKDSKKIGSEMQEKALGFS